jgi:hypothetical protein
MAKLRTTAITNTPVLQNLNASAGELNRFFTDTPGFANASRKSLPSLGQASVTGRQAMIAARPTITDLNRFAKPAPELGNNLSIVLRDLDTQSRAVEPDPRSPGGKGFSGLQALLGYVFNTALAINTYGPYGHVLAVDAFYDPQCSPYMSSTSLGMALKQDGPSYRHCYSWMGPNQPGVTTTDPSNPGGPIPDPGGAPPGQKGLSASARQTTPSPTQSTNTAASGSTASGPAINLHKTVGQIVSGTGMAKPVSSSSSGSAGSAGSGNQAKSLLNYLLAP